MTTATAAAGAPGRPPLASASPPSAFSRLLAWDVAATRRLHTAYARRFPSLLPLVALEYSGHGIPWLALPPAALAVGLATGAVDRRVLLAAGSPAALPAAATAGRAAAAYVGLVTDLALVGAVKVTARRRRPLWNAAGERGTVAAVDQYSFPSGHTTRVVLVATAVALTPGVRPAAVAAVAAWAAAVAASRVALGRHHVLDIVAGGVLGVVNYVAVTALVPALVGKVGELLAGEAATVAEVVAGA